MGNISKALKEIRKEYRITYDEIAAIIGKDKSTAYRLVNGKTEHDPKAIFEIVKQFREAGYDIELKNQEGIKIDTDTLLNIKLEWEYKGKITKNKAVPA
jgi:transcriptional regulator with XRE-family HTH domain